MNFLIGCGSLFTHTFNAAWHLDIFKLLVAMIFFRVSLGLFLTLYHGTKRM